MKYTCIESEYLVALLKCALKNEDVPDVPVGLNWEKLVKLSNEQQVYSTIAPVINKINIPVEQAQELTFYTQNELVRMIAMKNELEQIEKELEALKIDYMLLKGSVIKLCYPKQKMRQMSDVDILYHEKDRERLVSMMKKRGFLLETSEANTDDFFKPPYYTFEWHRTIFDERDEFHPDFDLWKRAKQDKEKPSKYNIDESDLFIYSICHAYDHYCQSGFGIRFICDIYLLLNKLENLDMTYVNSTLEDFGIKQFGEDTINLAMAIFEEKEISESEQSLLDFILSGGVYGKSAAFGEVIEEKYGGSKIKYIFKRLFPPKRQIMKTYRVCERHPVLLPLFYIVRIFQKYKFKRKKINKELSDLKNIK